MSLDKKHDNVKNSDARKSYLVPKSLSGLNKSLKKVVLISVKRKK